jgi:hypothetical protein
MSSISSEKQLLFLKQILSLLFSQTASGLSPGGNGATITLQCPVDLVPHDRLLTKISETGVQLRVVKWIKNFLLDRSQRVRVDGHLSEESE